MSRGEDVDDFKAGTNYFSPNNKRLPILTSRLMEMLMIQVHGHGWRLN
jgi:hypothetical protein